METRETIDHVGIIVGPTPKADHSFKHSLNSSYKIIDNNLEIIISYKEFSKIPDGSIIGLMITSENQARYIEIINHLKKKFSVSFSGETYLISEKEDRIKVCKKSSKGLILECDEILSYKGKRFELSGILYNGSNIHEPKINNVYLQNEDTKEKVFIENFTVNYSVNTFKISINLNIHPLYEGEWNLFSTINVNNKDEITSILFCKEQSKLQGDYLEYNNSLHYYEVYENKQSQVAFHIVKNKRKFISFDINGVALERNLLTIQGFLQVSLISSKEDKVTNIIFMNRDTKEKVNLPIDIDNNGAFSAKISFDDENNLIKENGTWDVFAALCISGVNELTRININSNQTSEEFISFSKPIYNNQLGFIKNVRSYKTVGGNLALHVTDQIVTCDITKAELEDGRTIVNGFVFNGDLDFSLKDIHLQKINGEEKIICKNEVKKDNNLFYFKTEIDWGTINIKEIIDSDFQFIITIIVKDKEYPLELVSNFDDISNKSRAIIYPLLRANNNGYPLQVRHFYNRKNAFLVSIGNTLNAYCIALRKRRKELEFEISSDIDQTLINSNDVELVLKNRNLDNEIKLSPQKNANNKYLFRINESLIKNLGLSIGSYEIFFAIKVNNFGVMTRVKGIDARIIERNSTFKSNAIRMNENIYYSLLIDQKSTSLNFEIRELKVIEKSGEKIKFLLAKGLAKMTRRFIKKPVWLIGENLGEIAQDNGFAFFQYCMKTENSEKYYYVSKQDNKNAENIKPYHANVLLYDSFKHYFLYWVCQYLIVSHGIRDTIPSIVHNKLNNNPKRIIYLQHGIIAMKKLQFNKDSYNGKIKKFVVSSVHEKNILIEKMNFKPKQVMVTGLSRFDNLIDKSKDNKIKEILLIPTWREWLIDSKTEFLTSEFYNQYIGLLRDPHLHGILEKYNLILKFFPHIEIQRKYMDSFSSLNERIEVVNIDKTTVRDLIQESSLLITDYSSVVFDFNYLRKPVVFFQFDLHDYLRHRGSYVDLRTDLIGDIADTKLELLNYISEYVKTDFKYKPIYNIKSKKYYAYHDQENSKRIYEEIKKIK
ncbi:CDP-glycerol glycerophosphotransferase family protein [Neobacillus soli]|nr:CDP-glycerol glycerophosphotransferase family protein [Neobacillus soli]